LNLERKRRAERSEERIVPIITRIESLYRENCKN